MKLKLSSHESSHIVATQLHANHRVQVLFLAHLDELLDRHILGTNATSGCSARVASQLIEPGAVVESHRQVLFAQRNKSRLDMNRQVKRVALFVRQIVKPYLINKK